ncbi:hypothetical protein F4Y93_12245 [Candidatus Poribacteria bacterium]|nr:hypothetical protein [Candidatus Poribacteria bacterium]
MTVPKPKLSDPPTEAELMDLLAWLKTKINTMAPMVAGWRRQRAEAMLALHDSHGHTLRMLAEDNDLANPTVLEAIDRARKRAS